MTHHFSTSAEFFGSVLGEARPGHGQFMGLPSLAGVVICISGKAQQQVAFAPEPEAQGPALGQIGTHARSHRGLHRWRRGQGSAACRSCSKCTLAYGAVISTERWPKTSAICLRSAPR